MAEEISLEQILKDQAETSELAMKLDDDSLTPEKRSKLTAKIVKRAKKLEALVASYEAQEKAKHAELLKASPVPPRAKVVVELTPDQRVRIRERTGVDIEAIRIDDPSGEMSATMPPTHPDSIELMATQYAKGIQTYFGTLAAVEAQLSPSDREVLRLSRKDPGLEETLYANVISGPEPIEIRPLPPEQQAEIEKGYAPEPEDDPADESEKKSKKKGKSAKKAAEQFFDDDDEGDGEAPEMPKKKGKKKAAEDFFADDEDLPEPPAKRDTAKALDLDDEDLPAPKKKPRGWGDL